MFAVPESAEAKVWSHSVLSPYGCRQHWYTDIVQMFCIHLPTVHADAAALLAWQSVL